MGKKQDFNNAYNAYWYQLFAHAKSILESKEAAEDVTQEVFLDLWNRLDDLEIKHYRGYLFKAVKFQCSKKLRSLPFTEVQLEILEVASHVEEYDFTHKREEENQLLLEKIDLLANEVLPEKCLQIFKLRFEENLSYKEIAAALGISISTVDNQLNKALKVIRTSGIYNSEIILIQLVLAGMYSLFR
ncbi:sigma-70 family RNA polymerase sigma factor [Flavobacterium sp. SM2513]|uniref:sigma-70 family RNA polymerase sigma factor n=1 Tax=Flavobacterium sp. SM2513 TaxID=3424766 RepID=UPI003D7F7A16